MKTRKEKHEKLDTVVELRKAGNKVAEWVNVETTARTDTYWLILK